MAEQMPIVDRAAARWGVRRWTRRKCRYFTYDMLYRDGTEILNLNSSAFDQEMQGHRYPADTHATRTGAQHACPESGCWSPGRLSLRSAAAIIAGSLEASPSCSVAVELRPVCPWEGFAD